MARTLIALALLTAGCGRIGFSASSRSDASDAVGDTAPGCSITNGLLGHWTFDAADITPSTARDSSGNGRDGAMVGTPGPSLAPGRIGESLDFSATTLAYVDLPTIPFDTTPGAFNTVTFWFFESNPQPSEVPVYLPEGPGTQPPRYDLWLDYFSSGMVSLCINSGIGECFGVADPSLIGRWVFVATVFVNGSIDGGTMYIDGVARSSCLYGDCSVSRSAMTPFRLGASQAQFVWKGMLDDVRVYNRALTPAEVQTLFACAP